MVKAITTAEYISEKNIAELKSLPQVNWKIKTDIKLLEKQIPIMVTNPLYHQQLKTNNQIYFTAITPHLNGATSYYNSEIDTSKGLIRIRAINLSITHMYIYLLSSIDAFPKSRINLINDSLKQMIYREGTGYRNVWDEQNTYCFEAVLPIRLTTEQLAQKINSDLDLYFNTRGKFIRQKVNGYQIVSDTSRIVLMNEPADSTSNLLIFNSITSLLAKLNNSYLGLPFYSAISSESKFRFFIDPKSLSDIKLLTKALNGQNFQLQPIEKEIEMFVLETINKSSK